MIWRSVYLWRARRASRARARVCCGGGPLEPCRKTGLGSHQYRGIGIGDHAWVGTPGTSSIISATTEARAAGQAAVTGPSGVAVLRLDLRRMWLRMQHQQAPHLPSLLKLIKRTREPGLRLTNATMCHGALPEVSFTLILSRAGNAFHFLVRDLRQLLSERLALPFYKSPTHEQ